MPKLLLAGHPTDFLAWGLSVRALQNKKFITNNEYQTIRWLGIL
jgi:hypothetical protein